MATTRITEVAGSLTPNPKAWITEVEGSSFQEGAAIARITEVLGGDNVFNAIAQITTVNMQMVFLGVSPTVQAGTDFILGAGERGQLNGGAEVDPSTSIISYVWILEDRTAGAPVISLSANNIAAPTFTAPISSFTYIYDFSLTVTDGFGLTATDFVQITIDPADVNIANRAGQWVPAGLLVATDAGWV